MAQSGALLRHRRALHARYPEYTHYFIIAIGILPEVQLKSGMVVTGFSL
jgi:hypothetical protein